MITKFGLILLVVLFGAVLFVLGILAPESVRRPVVNLTQNVGAKRAAPQLPVPAVSTPAQPSEKHVEPAAIPYQDLLIQSPLPPDGTYALELGQFATNERAHALAKRALEGGITTSTIAVTKKDGERWIAVVAGQYNSPNEARAARLSLSRTLALTQGMPVIRLPPKSTPDAATPTSPPTSP